MVIHGVSVVQVTRDGYTRCRLDKSLVTVIHGVSVGQVLGRVDKSLMVLECRLYLLVLNVETAYNVCITNCIPV